MIQYSFQGMFCFVFFFPFFSSLPNGQKVNHKKLFLTNVCLKGFMQGRSQGGIWGSEPPTPLAKFFGHFYQNSNKTMFRCVSTVLPHPQNPLPWRFLATPLHINPHPPLTQISMETSYRCLIVYFTSNVHKYI